MDLHQHQRWQLSKRPTASYAFEALGLRKVAQTVERNDADAPRYAGSAGGMGVGNGEDGKIIGIIFVFGKNELFCCVYLVASSSSSSSHPPPQLTLSLLPSFSLLPLIMGCVPSSVVDEEARARALPFYPSILLTYPLSPIRQAMTRSRISSGETRLWQRMRSRCYCSALASLARYTHMILLPTLSQTPTRLLVYCAQADEAYPSRWLYRARA